VEILGDDKGWVRAIKCVEMELGEPDASGRRRPVEKPGSEFEIQVDSVIMAIGTSPNPLIRTTTPGLETDPHGCIIVESEETGKTSREGVLRRWGRRDGRRDRHPRTWGRGKMRPPRSMPI
jgi:glutamate synthase (NADPH/NADH) small chain